MCPQPRVLTPTPKPDPETGVTPPVPTPKTKPGRRLSFVMTDYCRSAVNMYVDLTGMKPKRAASPYCPDGALPPHGETERGELNGKCCALLMKDLWLARLARPDIQHCICYLATHVTIWSRNDDKRIKRLVDYMYTTAEWALSGYIADPIDELGLTSTDNLLQASRLVRV